MSRSPTRSSTWGLSTLCSSENCWGLALDLGAAVLSRPPRRGSGGLRAGADALRAWTGTVFRGDALCCRCGAIGAMTERTWRRGSRNAKGAQAGRPGRGRGNADGTPPGRWRVPTSSSAATLSARTGSVDVEFGCAEPGGNPAACMHQLRALVPDSFSRRVARMRGCRCCAGAVTKALRLASRRGAGG